MQILDHDYIAAPIPRARRALLAFRGVLPNKYQAQSTYYWCGPASTRIALSCRGIQVSQAQMARELGTDEDGTDDVRLVVGVLNRHLKAKYSALYPTAGQVDAVWDTIVKSIDAGFGMVANIVAPANDHPPGYPNSEIWHYIAIVGRSTSGPRTVYVADPARFSGIEHYSISVEQLTRIVSRKWKGIATNPVAVAAPDYAAAAPFLAQLGPT